MSQTTLLSLTKDEAVVAENVTTYKRSEIEKQYVILSDRVKKDNEQLPTLRQQVKEIEERMQANLYALDLYKALLDQFNLKYPDTQAESAAEAESVVEEAEEKSEVPEQFDAEVSEEVQK